MPEPVRRIIDERADALGFQALQRASASLSEAYREGRRARLADSDRVAAYLLTRMPATYAATYSVLENLEGFGVNTILDAGAGTGAASLAARHFFPQASITMIERDPAMSEAARAWLPDAAVVQDDIRRISATPPADLVIAAWSLGEFGAEVAQRLWQAARVAFVAIEPGTPAGFALIRRIRGELLGSGARMIAPCPAGNACPMTEPDWCHFAARVERSSLHRRLKGGELGYEDEKFCYVALGREAGPLPPGRIIRRPAHRPGLIVLETCTPRGLESQRVTKRDREMFRAARKARWGDSLPPAPPRDTK